MSEPATTGPDGHEWAKTEAGFAFVEKMVPRADDPRNLMWFGWALREAFVAGAEWQEKRKGGGVVLPRYLATDTVPEDFMAMHSDQYPICPQCGGETGLISRPEEGRAWNCDCGWEGESRV